MTDSADPVEPLTMRVSGDYVTIYNLILHGSISIKSTAHPVIPRWRDVVRVVGHFLSRRPTLLGRNDVAVIGTLITVPPDGYGIEISEDVRGVVVSGNSVVARP
jgi:hypothetical protein